MKAEQTPPMKPEAAKPVNASNGPPSLAECEAQSRTKGEKALAEAARTVGPSQAYSCGDGDGDQDDD